MERDRDNTVDRPGILICQKCGHSWLPRRLKIKRCPNQKCQTVFWKEKTKGEKANDNNTGSQ